MSHDFCYNPPRPQLTIEIISTKRVYGETQTNFRVVSEHSLTHIQLTQMWDAGLFGRAQGFVIATHCTEPSLHVHKTQLSLGERPEENPVWDYYVYEVYTKCDSGG